MSWNQQDKSFKVLLNRRMTDSNLKSWYNEVGDFTINVNASEIWLSTPPSTPPTLSNLGTSGCVEFYQNFVLTQDVTVAGQQSWFASTNGLESGRLRDWISEKYNDPTVYQPLAGYAVQVYDYLGNAIPPTDNSQWLFDYATGVLTFKNATRTSGSAITSLSPFSISAYRYIGAKGTSLVSGPLSGGTPNYLPIWDSTGVTLADSLIRQDMATTLPDGKHLVVVNGHLTAISKQFTIDHPTRPDCNLVHGSLEGPENGAYFRGKKRGSGEVWVPFPEYWRALVGEEFTINLTPYGKYGICVNRIEEDGFFVSRLGNWFMRNKTIEFSFLVLGSRLDAPLNVVQRKRH